MLLGVTGSIAAFKAVELAGRLIASGKAVTVVMTRAARKFVTPLTFETVTRRPVGTKVFGPRSGEKIEHISLADAADCLVIAPATANFIAKMACGIADDLLSTTALSVTCPTIVAPAMNHRMWKHPATQKNVATLKSRGVLFVGPEEGRLASGEVGMGRLAALEKIEHALDEALS